MGHRGRARFSLRLAFAAANQAEREGERKEGGRARGRKRSSSPPAADHRLSSDREVPRSLVLVSFSSSSPEGRMYIAHYQRLSRVLRSPGHSWWPYGGADWNMFALWTLLINAPPREEALKACSASKVVRELSNMAGSRGRLLKVRPLPSSPLPTTLAASAEPTATNPSSLPSPRLSSATCSAFRSCCRFWGRSSSCPSSASAPPSSASPSASAAR